MGMMKLLCSAGLAVALAACGSEQPAAPALGFFGAGGAVGNESAAGLGLGQRGSDFYCHC